MKGASPAARMAAFGIDLLLAWLALVCLPIPLRPAALLLLLPARGCLEGLFGVTPGKWLLGLRLRNDHGGRAGMGPCMVRNLLLVVDLSLYGLPGLVLIQRGPGHQRLGDRLAGTLVVRHAPCPATGGSIARAVAQKGRDSGSRWSAARG